MTTTIDDDPMQIVRRYGTGRVRCLFIYKLYESYNMIFFISFKNYVECVFPVVVSILPHVEFEPSDHWKDASHLNINVLLVFEELQINTYVKSNTST